MKIALRHSMQEILDWHEDKIARMILAKPAQSYQEIGEKYGVEASFVAKVVVKRGIRRPEGLGLARPPQAQGEQAWRGIKGV
jgi:2,3-bisphosphoglycerate-independent phosphoglycerate mutase